LTNPSKDDIINKMRKLSLGVVYCATVSVVLILGACMKPVGVMDFLNDEKVQNIIEKGKIKGKAQIEIDYEQDGDLYPVLSSGGVTLDKIVTYSKGGPDVIIEVSNAVAVGYSSLQWYLDGATPLTAGVSLAGTRFTITAGNAPFNAVGTYQLTVVGTANSAPHSTMILVEVEE
jgi:hypothetical protein